MKLMPVGIPSPMSGENPNVRRDTLISGLTAVLPVLLCLFGIACAMMQPFSAFHSTNTIFNANNREPYGNSDTCVFGDATCVARQEQFQVAQAGFLARQYPLIMKNSRQLDTDRAIAASHSNAPSKEYLENLTLKVKVMTELYNAHASRTETSLLTQRHLPAHLAQ